MIDWYWYVLFAAVGLVVGTQVNRAIYDWAWFTEYSPSPWSNKPKLGPIAMWQWLPVLGWFGTAAWNGKTLYPTALEQAAPEERGWIPVWTSFSGIRPAMVELLCGVGFPFLAWYYFEGGWGGTAWDVKLITGGAITVLVCVVFHYIVLALSLVAALIDWDERTIPDQVTTTGVLLSLIVLFAWPDARLPDMSFDGIVVASIEPLQVFSPQPFLNGMGEGAGNRELPEGMEWLAWSYYEGAIEPTGWPGLFTALLAWVFWAFLILPSLWTTRFGWKRMLWLAWVSVRQPPRRTGGMATRSRKISLVTWSAMAVCAIAWTLVIIAWNLGGDRWESVYSTSVSMAVAGAGTWAIRLLATWVMGREALGFGDVTLMFMIGAAFGWQFALMVFAIAPVLAIGYAVFRMVTAGDNALAFGPWLVAAAWWILLFWSNFWQEYSRDTIFGMGPFLCVILASCLALMPVVLGLLVAVKSLLGMGQASHP